MNTAPAWGITHTARDMPLGVFVEGDHVRGGSYAGQGAYTQGGEGHRLIVGPTGSGKFQAAIAPLLLTADDASVIVFDIASGEAARDTGPWRATLGPVLTLDPYRLASDGRGAINPLDALGDDDGGMLTRARALADAVMMTTKSGGDSDYWNGQARDFLVALLIHVKTSRLESDRTLGRIRDLVRGPVHDTKMPDGTTLPGIGIGTMRGNNAAGGYVRDAANNVQEDMELSEGRNFFYVRQTLRDNTAFLDEPEIRRVTSTTTLDLRQLREGVATLYVVAPSAQLSILGRWLRLVYACALPVMQQPDDERRHARGDGIPLHVILDEFAAFGAFHRVTNDMATVRKYGIQFSIAVQKLSQLRSIYHDGWETFVPKYMHVLGSDEQFTSEYVSKRIGTHMIQSKSTSQQRHNTGGNQGETLNERRVSIKEPHDISAMPPERCYVVISGNRRLVDLRKWWVFADPSLLERKETPAPAQLSAPAPSFTNVSFSMGSGGTINVPARKRD